jgi:hypothetical protein
MAVVMGANAVVIAQAELSDSYSRIFAGISGETYQGPGTRKVRHERADPVNSRWWVTALGETYAAGARVHAFVESDPAYGQVVNSAYAEYGFAFRIVETQPPPWYSFLGVPTELPWWTRAELINTAYSSARTVHATAQIFVDDVRIASSFRDTPGVYQISGVYSSWKQPGQIYTIGYRTSCTVANPHTGGRASCSANADPLLSFDQAALDAFARNSGRQTFSLSDYYRIEYSPDLPIVPEPAMVSLLATAGAILAIRRCRKPAYSPC